MFGWLCVPEGSEQIVAQRAARRVVPAVGLLERVVGQRVQLALGSLVEGLSLRLRYDRDDTNELTTSEDGEDQAWGLPGVCFEALVDRFYT